MSFAIPGGNRDGYPADLPLTLKVDGSKKPKAVPCKQADNGFLATLV